MTYCTPNNAFPSFLKFKILYDGGRGVFPSERSVFLWFTTVYCYLETILFKAEFFITPVFWKHLTKFGLQIYPYQ